ncbi:MAG: DUF3783 domain-containing protein [Deltaproteobacteria bacterium]|nr:DUF3783 domain-containing protein [Deltaproteobacteria bacterium]
MEHKGTFTKISKSGKRMYGPRGLLVCGYLEAERMDLINLLDQADLTGIRVVFACSDDLETRVGDVITKEDRAGLDGVSDMPRAIVMSGLIQHELHNLMAAYKKEGLVRQIWASLTPVSEGWPLKDLLNELQKEDKVMRNKR